MGALPVTADINVPPHVVFARPTVLCSAAMHYPGLFAGMGAMPVAADIKIMVLQATRAYLHAEADVEAALRQAGFKVTKREMTATSFYFSRLLEAKRI